MKLLLYCTKNKPYLIQGFARPYHTIDTSNPFNYKWGLINYKSQNALNGKIVAECDFEVEEIKYYNSQEKNTHYEWFEFKGLNVGDEDCELLKNSCLTFSELFNYLDKGGYAIHIKNLHIYDRPRDLFYYTCVKGPRNMQYVYSAYDKNENALISIQPQWLCKILNGKKTIEVRRKVLKGMIENGY